MKRIMFIWFIFLVISVFSGCDSSDYTVDKLSRQKEYADVFLFDFPLLEDVNETTILKTLHGEMEKNLAEIDGYDKVKTALLSFDEQNTGKQLKYKLPANVEKLETGDIKMLLKSFVALIGVKYHLENKILFNSELLHIPGIISQKYKATAEQIVYWHWKNCFVANKVFHRTKTRFSAYY